MVVFPNAKVNLGLNVVDKREDGYHDIETIFYAVDWKDALEILPSKEFQFSIIGKDIPGDLEDNLVVKVYRAFQDQYKVGGCKIVLDKHIPMGAGLGGGSADAAFCATALNSFFQLNLSLEHLEDLVRPLGADCAFFVRNSPVYGFGKGDQFQEVVCDLSNYSWLFIHPEVHVSTSHAYAGLTPRRPDVNVKEVLALPVESWKDRLVNDFEETVFEQFPVIRDIKNACYQAGATFSLMSGSGSTVFALFKGDIPSNFVNEMRAKYTVHEA